MEVFNIFSMGKSSNYSWGMHKGDFPAMELIPGGDKSIDLMAVTKSSKSIGGCRRTSVEVMAKEVAASECKYPLVI